MIRNAAVVLLFTVVVVFFAIIVCIEHRPQGYALPLVQTSSPASQVPWRLFTVCNPNRKNVPVLEPEVKT